MRRTAGAFGLFIAVAGGVFLGLFSCGGYAWHEQAICGAIAASALIVIGTSIGSRRSMASGLLFTAAVWGLFIVTMATASTFYPGPPESMGGFVDRFWIGLAYEPC